jgi:hypothetical protein
LRYRLNNPYPNSEIRKPPKSETFCPPKKQLKSHPADCPLLPTAPASSSLNASNVPSHDDEHNAIQMWILVNKFNAQFEVVIKSSARVVFMYTLNKAYIFISSTGYET